MADSATDEGEPELEIPKQPGLEFKVLLYLYDDVLNMCAGDHFWGEWFPCKDADVVLEFRAAVAGLLSGEFRIVEHSRWGRLVKAILERPSDSGWQPAYRHYPGLSLPWLPTRKQVLRNGAA